MFIFLIGVFGGDRYGLQLRDVLREPIHKEEARDHKRQPAAQRGGLQVVVLLGWMRLCLHKNIHIRTRTRHTTKNLSALCLNADENLETNARTQRATKTHTKHTNKKHKRKHTTNA